MSDLVTDNLPLIATAPDGIKRLRGLILELAVRGKLVPQDPADEPASELLKRIEAEKARLVKEGKIRKAKAVEAVGEDERPFDVLEGWVWTQLGDLVRVVNGRAYKKEELLDSGPTPVLRVGNLFTSNHWYYSDLNLEEDKYCQPGDLIFAWSASFGPFIWDGPEVIYHYHIWKLDFIDRSSVDRDFLHLFLREKTEEIKAAGHGVSMIHMTKEKMEQLEVPLPPLREQHRIVARVDELMALCDRLEAEQTDAAEAHARLVDALLATLTASRDAAECAANWQRLSEHFDTLFTTEASITALKQTVLQLAVMGRLVPQDPTDEPASELLKRIEAEKARLVKEGKIRKPKAVEPVGEDERPFEVSAGWKWLRFGEVTICRDGERVPVSRDEREHREKLYDYYGASGVIDKIDGYLFDKPLLLIGEDGANLINRSTPIAFMARGRYWVNNHAHVIDGLSEEFLRFIELYINATDLKPYVTGTAQPKMNQEKLNRIPVALPPLPEQHRIVAKVDELMALCDRLQADLATAREHRARLADTLVQAALEAA